MSWDWAYRPHVSAAKRRERAAKAARKLVKEGQSLQPICIEGRHIAHTFWGKAWCTNLESYSDYASRLPRGRSYVRNGAVLDLQIAPGTVKALISGTEVYRVNIKITPIKAAAWKALKKECAGRVGSLIDLLQGKLSAPVMEVMTRRESGLFPKPAEIRLDCSCPDWADMCKHVAATLYGVGARLDQSPELLFVLRGADHLELINEATESITTGATTGDAATLASGDIAEVFGIEVEPPITEVEPPIMAPPGPAPVPPADIPENDVTVKPVAPQPAPAPIVVRYRGIARRKTSAVAKAPKARARRKATAAQAAREKKKAASRKKSGPSSKSRRA